MIRVGAVCPFSSLLTGEPSCTARLLHSLCSRADCCSYSFRWFLLAYFKQIKMLLCFPFKFHFSVQPLEGFGDFFFFLLHEMYNCNLLHYISCGAFAKT